MTFDFIFGQYCIFTKFALRTCRRRCTTFPCFDNSLSNKKCSCKNNLLYFLILFTRPHFLNVFACFVLVIELAGQVDLSLLPLCVSTCTKVYFQSRYLVYFDVLLQSFSCFMINNDGLRNLCILTRKRLGVDILKESILL